MGHAILGGSHGAILSRRSLLISGGLTAGLAAITSPLALAAAANPFDVSVFDPSWATDWHTVCFDLTWRNTTIHQFGPTPTNAARCYNYLALAMYEACVDGMPQHLSVAGQLTDLPARAKASGRIDWPTALAVAAHNTAASIYATAPEIERANLTALRDRQVAARRAAGVSPGIIAKSSQHGSAVATWLLKWIETDGHREIVDLPYTPPVGEGLWESTPPNYRPAIEPHWSRIRPMVMRSAGEVRPEPHIPFSTVPGSAFHNEAMTPYLTSKTLTDEQRAIARFWTDNPLLSGLPSGHWLRAVGQVAVQRRLNLAQTLEAYARAGVALHDAFLSCWTHKYEVTLIRPVTYVRRYIDKDWVTFVNTPQFPEYTSGHSVSSMAAATVLTELLGNFGYHDDSHRDRNLPARDFTSFTHAAEEAAISRIYGGIHFPMGIEAGKEQGNEVGRIVIDRLITRR